MVWFQCEDCGDNLKKPKLPNHFRMCSASKLSCIDCGETFGRQTVESHTQCISEAEKYGPKGQGKASNGTPANDSKPKKPDVDIDVGLSDRPPWFCSLCNTNATSKQTLLAHAEGKKHRAKARAFHASKQTDIVVDGKTEKSEIPENKLKEEKAEAENGNSSSNTKRKERESENGSRDNGEVIQIEKEEKSKHKKKVKAAGKKKTKWKKLITSALKSHSDILKLKKLKEVVVKSVKECGIVEDESQVSDMIENKINSSSRFIVDGKYVRLAAKS